MPWQLCSASVKPAGIIQVFLEKSKTIPENSIKFKTEVIFIKICYKAYSTSLCIGIYTCIWATYAPSNPCIHIYGCYVYVFSLLWMLIYIMSFPYTILACCKLVVLHHYPPTRRVTFNSRQKKSLNAMIQGGSGLATWLRRILCFVWGVLFTYMGIYTCKHLVFAPTCPKYNPSVLNKCVQHCQMRTNNTLTGVIVSTMHAKNHLFGSCATAIN